MELAACAPYHSGMKLTRICAALCALPLAVSSLAIDLPDLGDSAVGNLPLHEEQRIAALSVRELRESGEVQEDVEISDYLNRLGYQLVLHSNDSRFNFRFFPISSPQINAWAIPGGVIGVNCGLIVLTQHESELAAVMAHEIGHVTQHHYARMVESQKGSGFLTLASLALAILAARNSSNPDTATGAIAAGQGYQIQRMLSFSREFEREADQAGMQTLQASGYDPSAMPTFFDRMQKFYRNVDNGAFAFLRTHPVTTERIASAEARAGKQPYKQWTDSQDYLFVRERVRVFQLGNQEAVPYYAATTAEKKFSNEAAHQYGYAAALLQAGRYDEAWTHVSAARKALGGDHAMLASLAGQIRLAQGQYAEAARLFNEGAARFPSSTSLKYGRIDVMLREGRNREAAEEAQKALSARADDPGLHQRLAQAYTGLGQNGPAHRAMGEYYALMDEPTAAIRQMQLALKEGGDFYQLSAIESRIRELRDQLPVDKNGKPIEPGKDQP